MTDAIIAAYQDLQQYQRDILQTTMQPLATLLDKHVNAHRTPVRCVVGLTVCGRQATGRQAPNGTPACAHHGGTFPLDLVDPRAWSSTS